MQEVGGLATTLQQLPTTVAESQALGVSQPSTGEQPLQVQRPQQAPQLAGPPAEEEHVVATRPATREVRLFQSVVPKTFFGFMLAMCSNWS